MNAEKYRYVIVLLFLIPLAVQSCKKDEPVKELLKIESLLTHVSSFGGSDGAIDIEVSGGITPYSYSWSNGSVNEDQDHLAAGNYIVTVTDAEKTSVSDTFTLVQPGPSPLTLIITGVDVSTHGGSDGEAHAEVHGGIPPYDYHWSTGSGENFISALVSGWYSLTVTDTESEQVSDSIFIDQPGINELVVNYTLTNPSETGANDGAVDTDVSGGFPPYEFAWSTGSTEEDLEGLYAGEYTLSVTDSEAQSIVEIITVTDSVADTDGNNYAYIKIGSQTWMKTNLNTTHAPDGSPVENFAYDDSEPNTDLYGRLYTWNAMMNGSAEEAAQGICPCGWHIPTDGEFKTLEIYLGMTKEEADMENTWRGSGVGDKLKIGGDSGYDALLSGRRSSSGAYSLLGSFEYVWTSTEFGSNAWRRCLDINSDKVGRWNTFPKTYGFSVRCIKDTE